MAEAVWNGIKIEIKQGDIAAQADMTAVVCAANAMLTSGGGVAGALHRAAGPGLAREGTRYAPIAPGEVVITAAYELPNQYVLHCLGPVYGVDKPEADLLARCYRGAIELADAKEIESIAFPAISTGIFGYPVEQAARVALQTIKETADRLKHVKHIRMVLYDQSTTRIHEQALQSIAD